MSEDNRGVLLLVVFILVAVIVSFATGLRIASELHNEADSVKHHPIREWEQLTCEEQVRFDHLVSTGCSQPVFSRHIYDSAVALAIKEEK